MNTKKILIIIFSILLVGAFAFILTWGIINFNKVKEGFSGTNLYTQEDLIEAKKEGFEEAKVNEQKYLDELESYSNLIVEYEELVNKLNKEKLEYGNQKYNEGYTAGFDSNSMTQEELEDLLNKEYEAGYNDGYAQLEYDESHRYFVIYNANIPSVNVGEFSGSMPMSVHYINEESNLRNNNYSIFGYKFVGWNTSADGTGISYSDGQTIVSDKVETLNLYAQWELKTHNISYDLNGGVLSKENPTVVYEIGDSFMLNNPTKYGYNFVGWTGNGITTPIKNMLVESGVTEDLFFVANYEINLAEMGSEGVVYVGLNNAGEITSNTEEIVSYMVGNNSSTVGNGYVGTENTVYIPAIYNNKPVTHIGEHAFSGSKLTSIYIASSVKHVGKSAFNGCFASMIFAEEGAIESLGVGAFAFSTGEIKINLAEGMTEIPKQVFFDAKGLKTINLPSTLKIINQYAFRGSGLTEITIPASVTNINLQAFCDCSDLKTMTFLSAVPPTLQSVNDLPSDVIHSIYVYANYVEAYRTAEIWKTFVNVIKVI